MYYVENRRDNYAHTIGSAVTRAGAKELVLKEKTRMERKGIKKHGEFRIIRVEERGTCMRVKNSRDTYAYKEGA